MWTHRPWAETPMFSICALVLLTLVFAVACDLESAEVLPDGSHFMGGNTCGNGQIDIGEECDADEFRAPRCHKGKLVCLPDCTLDKKACTEFCGDRELNGDEQCEVTSYGLVFAVSCLKGTQRCNDDCTVDRSGCEAWCGDGKILAGVEACDGAGSINSGVCYEGTVACDPGDCSIDFTKCQQYCGDEVINGREQCDRTEFFFPCHDTSGTLTCRPDCTIDPGTCKAWCGDGKLNNINEDCDGEQYREAKPCAAATCRADCEVDASKCP
jgi:hypothetical protein